MKKVLLTLFSITVIVVGIYFTIGLFSTNPPVPTLNVGSKNVEVVQGSYCWTGLLRSVCADSIAPVDLVEHHNLKPAVVPPEAVIKIKFKNKPDENTLGANIWLGDGNPENVEVIDDTITLPYEKGVYVYDLFAHWKKGSASYVFTVEVQ